MFFSILFQTLDTYRSAHLTYPNLRLSTFERRYEIGENETVNPDELEAMMTHNDNNQNTADRVSVSHEKGAHIQEVINISRPVEAVYAFWKNASNLPKIVPHLQTVEDDGNGYGSWTFQLPVGPQAIIQVELINELANEVIGWRSVGSSAVSNAGAVRFRSLSPENTEVTLQAEYQLPLGVLGEVATKVLGMQPTDMVRKTLDNLKAHLEGTATVNGASQY